ncbi:MAG TPA: flavin reductase [Terrimicrobiaceae bacterium]|nr:flavin reductase [Terrimicrobiaceae bacterium]
MELDLQGEHAARSYAALVSLVVPRPIAWVTTVNVDGAINAAPFSFFNVLGSKPPIVGICPGDRETVCQRIPLGTFASRMSLSSILLMKRSQNR